MAALNQRQLVDKVYENQSDIRDKKAEIVNEGSARVLRYIKALPSQGLCLNCHGDPEKMTAEVKAQIAKTYPNDLAVGYREGEIRGALTVKRPL